MNDDHDPEVTGGDMEPDDPIEDEREEDERRGRFRRNALRAAGALALLALGAIGGVVWAERRAAKQPAASVSAPSASSPAAAPRSSAAGGAAAKDEAVEVTLAEDAMERAGIKTVEVRSQSLVSVISVPGTVTSNAYRETKVNALVGGVVRQVPVELGAPVKRGQPVAVVFSAELAEAQMKYLSMRAMLEADNQKRVRVEKLTSMGAASRQEL
jgi:cobalt-zinc-cadmium efflux system membrane fusion protein